MTNGAYLVKVRNDPGDIVKLGGVINVAINGDDATIHILTTSNGVPIAWDGSTFITNTLEDPETIKAILDDIVRQLYNDTYNITTGTDTVTPPYPQELLAIIGE